jgi:enediyne biosynthesis protein E4
MGYASSSHAGVHFGLGATADAVRVEIQWPSGVRQTIDNVKTNQAVRVEEQ